MVQDPRYIEQLISKFQDGSINPDEYKSLLDWYNGHDDSQVTIPVTKLEDPEQIKERVLGGLMSRIKEESPTRISRFRAYRWHWAAAAMLLFAFAATWSGLKYFGSDKEHIELAHTTIEPGGNKATLTLANGKEIVLRTDQEGIIVGNSISYRDGSGVADDDLTDLGENSKQLILQTPRGGTYQITLPDGTEAWLNAATTLKYPSRFTDEHRTVEVQGEAYFDVQSAYRSDGSKIPFKVISKQQEIEVVGTRFNISAYPQQPYSKTTLIEGTVILKDRGRHFVLKPGDQATTTAKDTKLRQVQTATYTSWRNGKFSFDDKSFAEIMNEIGHWYDLTIVYEGKIPKEELVGDAFRNQNLQFVLRVLDVAEIDYSIDVPNRRLIIKEKKHHT
jgi:ferric-dicitrate binding protein FerR (iron transport regulator)